MTRAGRIRCEKAARCAERHRQVELAAARIELHVGRVDERSAG